MPDQIQPGMQCVEVEALLADAIDGTLHGATLAAFEAHRDSLPRLPHHGGRSQPRHALAEGVG